MNIVVIIEEPRHSRWDSLPHVFRIPKVLCLSKRDDQIYPILPAYTDVLVVPKRFSRKALKHLERDSSARIGKIHHARDDGDTREIVLKYTKEKAEKKWAR